MKSSPIKILMLESLIETESELTQVLIKNGYQTESLCDIEIAIEKISNQSIDLVICENSFGEYNGFAVFKLLMKYLRNYDIPFFLVLDNFEKEDMLIGLEMGINNFIVYPLNHDSICYKIENQLSKKVELNIFETKKFKSYFNFSLIAMCYVEDNKIRLVNQAFNKIYDGCNTEILEKSLLDVFNISENKQNELNYRRFQNGITDYCKLVEVQSVKNVDTKFDISFYRGKNQGTKHVFAEIIENKDGKESDQINEVEKTKNVLTKLFYTENIKLTIREQQVFKLSANGLPIKLIANELGLSERTVEKHRANIMAKADAKNMIEAIINIQQSFVP